MLEKLIQKNKGSLIATLLLMVAVFASVQLVFLTYSNNLNMQKRYEGAVQSASDLETGRDLSLWEINQAGGSWDTNLSNTTYDSSCRFPNAYLDVNGFYRLPGYKFRAKVKNNGGIVSIYVHAFKREVTVTPPKYEYSRYAEYLYTPMPLYQYFHFANQDLTYGDADKIYEVNGGRIHSNHDIVLYPPGTRYDQWGGGYEFGIRFRDLAGMSANGTIRYERLQYYPSPYHIDFLDAYDENFNGIIDASEYINATTVGAYPFRGGMAPCPFINTTIHFYTTNGTLVQPGPLMSQSGQPGYDSWMYMNSKYGYGQWLSGNSDSYGYFRGNWNNGAPKNESYAPLLWRGEESMFYGKQYNGSGYDDRMLNERTVYWLSRDGGGSEENDISYKATVIAFNLTGSDFSGLQSYQTINGTYYNDNVYFRPKKNDLGANNTNTWFEIPGGLPGAYKWQKYEGDGSSPQNNVRFYFTEPCDCLSNTSCPAGCALDNAWNDAGTYLRGWRYRRTHPSVGTCIPGNASGPRNDTLCYNNSSSNYVLANIDLNIVNTSGLDENTQFFNDGFSYGNDWNDPEAATRKAHAFNSEMQKDTGFKTYSQILANWYYYTNFFQSGIPKKSFDLGQVFNSPSLPALSDPDSPYAQKARVKGIYIGNIGSADCPDTVVARLNASVIGYPLIATHTWFRNWRTLQDINLVDINVGQLAAAQIAVKATPALMLPGGEIVRDFVGLIYSRYPLRLSNAANLPGTNDGNRKAAFTAICEESIYLKGNFNYESSYPDNWKLAHLVTKKMFYALSSNFSSPQVTQYTTTYYGYPQGLASYPYVYLKHNATAPLECLPEIGDPTLHNGEWIGYENIADFYDYAPCIKNQVNYTNRNVTATFANSTRASWQTQWTSSSYKPYPNNANYVQYYSALFLGPYFNINSDYVSTSYHSGNGQNKLNWELENWNNANIYINGSFIYLYDPSDSNNNDEYYTAINASENNFNYSRQPKNLSNDSSPNNLYGSAGKTVYGPTFHESYDARLPQVTPKNYEAVLGLTGETIWRQVSETYFNQESQ
jgi:hypothetical protein